MINTVSLNQEQPIVRLTEKPDSILYLPPYISVYMDKMTGLKPEEAMELWKNGQFTPLEDLVYPTKFKSGLYHYWLQFYLENATEDTLALVLKIPRLDSNFYYQYTDNQLTRKALFGGKLSWTAFQELGLNILDYSALPIKLPPYSKHNILCRASDNLYLTAKIRPELYSSESHSRILYQRNYHKVFLDVFILGILFFLTFFSLLQFTQNKDKAFLFYGLYVGATFLFNWILFDYSNFIFRVIPRLMADRNYIRVPVEVSIVVTYLFFIHFFINERRQHPLLFRLTKKMLIFSGIYLILSLFLSLIEIRYVMMMHFIYLFTVSVSSLLIVYQIWKIGTKLSKYLFWGMLSLAFFSLILSVYLRSGFTKEHNLPIKDFADVFLQIGILIELLFFSLGLGYKRYLADRARIKALQEKRHIEKLESFKTKLYTNITHEFRTPLTVINGITKKLQGQVDFAAREGLILIERNGQQLLNLVNQMLDLSKLESGHLTLNLEKGDVIVYLKYLLESFHSLAANKNIALHFKTSQQHYLMDFDAEKLRQIVSNLLQNAIKFTPKDGQIYLQVKAQRSYLFVEVADNGIGIPAHQLPQVFDRFYQADSSTTRKGEGTGIGLTLTKELVKLLGGTIEVESKLGSGSRFYFTLPITNNAEKSIELANPKKRILEKNPMDVSVNLSSFTVDKAPISLLIIEDNADVVRYLSMIIPVNYQITTAINGKIGLSKAQKDIPDIILCDVMMPEMDGFEVCKQLKTSLSTSHIPIILLTAKADFESKMDGLSYGADAYLTKPFAEKELQIRLKQLVESRRKLQQYYTIEIFQNETVLNKDTPTLTPQDKAFMEQLVQLVEDNLKDPLFSAEQLCGLLFMSYSTCLRKVKTLTGMTIVDYIHHIKLQKAAYWLKANREKTILQIALEVGYNSQGYFSRVFKKHFNCTPSQFREQ